MEPHEEDLRLAEELGELINRRNLVEAKQRGLERIGSRDPKEVAAELAFQVALACSLLKDTTSMPWTDLVKYRGFTGRMAGDRLRDETLEAIRAGKHDEARSLLTRAHKYAARDSDANRRIVLEYVEGRLAQSMGNWRLAVAHYDRALYRWGFIAEPNLQWIQNCRYHWLELLAYLYGPGRIRDTWRFSKVEKSWKRRAAAWFFALLGGPGTAAVDYGLRKWL